VKQNLALNLKSRTVIKTKDKANKLKYLWTYHLKPKLTL